MDFNGRLVKLCALLRVIILLLYTNHVHRGALSQFAFAGSKGGTWTYASPNGGAAAIAGTGMFDHLFRNVANLQIQNGNGASTSTMILNGPGSSASTMASNSGPGSSSSMMFSKDGGSGITIVNGGTGSSSSTMITGSGASGITIVNGIVNCGGQICPQGSKGCHLETRSVDNDMNIRTQQTCYDGLGMVTQTYVNTDPNPNPGSKVHMRSSSGGSWFQS